MKITNDSAIRPASPRKKEAASKGGNFQTFLEAEIAETTAVQAEQTDSGAAHTEHDDAAWKTLSDCVELLDRAMHCLEKGDEPPANLAVDIEQLRLKLHHQLEERTPSGAALRQADTMLAVEAERIRNIQS